MTLSDMLLSAVLGLSVISLLLLVLRRSASQTTVIELRAAVQEQAETIRALQTSFRSEASTQRQELGQSIFSQTAAIAERIEQGRVQVSETLARQTEDIGRSLRAATEGQMQRLAELQQALRDSLQSSSQALEANTRRVTELDEGIRTRVEAVRDKLGTSLDELRVANESKLEQMRWTVDEKLHGTLETRLGESFKIVSERLEEVHRGLGEMQTLATGVGDLKRILGNVKSRGAWGEVQLGLLLEDMLTPDQYLRNAKVRPDTGEMVEFAVRLPGQTDTGVVLLPIDAKYPHEDYERLLNVQEVGTAEDVEKASVALERAVRNQARTISEKYINPPTSTDFALLYLPSEGLYAELLRRPGLVAGMQSNFRVIVTGPTTLSAFLNSLQMGFRTLAIERRSSEVWQILEGAKAEFMRYGHVWEKLGKQLETAKRTVEEAGRRTRAVERKLKNVELAGITNRPVDFDLDDEEGDQREEQDDAVDPT